MSRLFEQCEDCAKKHLRAAMAYASAFPERSYVTADTVRGFASQAAVLLMETPAYPEHERLAYGMLTAAEDHCVLCGIKREVYDRIRGIRLSGGTPTETALALVQAPEGFVDLAVGHLREAVREGRIALPETVTAEWLDENFDGLVKQASCPAETRAAEPEPGDGKGGE